MYVCVAVSAVSYIMSSLAHSHLRLQYIQLSKHSAARRAMPMQSVCSFGPASAFTAVCIPMRLHRHIVSESFYNKQRLLKAPVYNSCRGKTINCTTSALTHSKCNQFALATGRTETARHPWLFLGCYPAVRRPTVRWGELLHRVLARPYGLCPDECAKYNS